MWTLGIGLIELVLSLSVAVVVTLSWGRPRRWLGAMLAISVVAIILTPADLMSMLLVALPLAATFAVGVYAAPYLHPINSIAKPSDR